MKTFSVFMVILGASILWPTAISFGACPEAPNDNGICDTMYVEFNPPDTVFYFPGQLVRVPIYVTHDIPDPFIDSLVGMLIPLCYTHTNPTKYCSLSSYWNLLIPTSSTISRCIFRDLNDTTPNRFMEMYGMSNPLWYYDFVLDVSTSGRHFWFIWSGTTLESPRWGESSRDLALTVTFKVQDTMTVCIDSCFWPPSDRLAFARYDGALYIPRHNLPHCFSVSCPVRGNPTGGGVNGDCRVDVADVVFLIGYLYKGGPAPNPLERGDADCSGVVDIGDVMFLINYLFRGGRAPSC